MISAPPAGGPGGGKPVGWKFEKGGGGVMNGAHLSVGFTEFEYARNTPATCYEFLFSE